MRKPLVVGNWKMHGDTQSVASLLSSICTKADSLAETEVAICPPFPFLAQSQDILSDTGIKLGSQDVCAFANGAYTGQVSASMLKAFGCRYAIVGHSERRQFNRETSEEIAQKYIAAKQAGLIPILCVGETRAERDAGQTQAVITAQLAPLLDDRTFFEEGVIAYEPMWAIGTGLTATPDQAQAVHAFIRELVGVDSLRVLYGGSVKRDNAKALFAMSDIDGGLIGGASLDAEAFMDVCLSAG